MTCKVAPFRVDALTGDLGILHPEQTGLACAVQAVRLVVTQGEYSRTHVVVRAVAPPWRLPTEDGAVRALFPSDFVSWSLADAPGRIELSSSVGSEFEVQGAAAAAATLQRSWGWDESPLIAVHLVSAARSFSLNPTFTDGAWTVVVN